MSFKKTFSNFRRMFDDFERRFAEFDAAFEEAEREDADAHPPKAGETVTTRREEVRPDGTRVVTTITRNRR